MSRFTMATDLESWRDGQRSDRQARRGGGGRRRKGRKGRKGREGGGRQAPARAGAQPG